MRSLISPRIFAVTLFLCFAVVWPQQAHAQCAASYSDWDTDGSGVSGWSEVYDWYNNGGCGTGWVAFVHYYTAWVYITSPTRNAYGSQNSSAFDGGGGAQSSSELDIDSEQGDWEVDSGVEIDCSIAGEIYNVSSSNRFSIALRDTYWTNCTVNPTTSVVSCSTYACLPGTSPTCAGGFSIGGFIGTPAYVHQGWLVVGGRCFIAFADEALGPGACS